MSKYVEVRGVKIGEGVPKICVPIVGKTKEEILAAARSFEDVALDVVEWRVAVSYTHLTTTLQGLLIFCFL